MIKYDLSEKTDDMLDVKYARTDVLVRHTDGHTASQPARQAGIHTSVHDRTCARTPISFDT